MSQKVHFLPIGHLPTSSETFVPSKGRKATDLEKICFEAVFNKKAGVINREWLLEAEILEKIKVLNIFQGGKEYIIKVYNKTLRKHERIAVYIGTQKQKLSVYRPVTKLIINQAHC